MPAAEYDLVIEQGATFQRMLTYRINGTPVDLSGYTARLQIRANIADPSPILDLSTDNMGITLGGSAGTITLAIIAATTAALTFITGRYDLEIQAPNGTVSRLLEGRVTLSQEVTR